RELHLDAFLVALSDAFALSRALDSGEAGRGSVEAQWVAPSSFTRVTRKFWLRPGDVTRFKAAVIPHLPVLIYGDRTRLLDLEELREGADDQACVALPLPGGAPAPLRRVSDAALVTSVYLDSPPELPLYHARLARDDRAIALRVRWYGDEPPGPQSRVFMERKVHREAWTGALSSKDRAPLLYAQVADLLSGQGVDPTLAARAKKEGRKKKRLLSFSARVLRNVAFPEEQARGSPFQPAAAPPQLEPSDFLREVATLVQQTRARPLLRTVYRRTAFQEPTTAAVRLSMDVDLHMVREVGAAKRPGDWARDVAGAPLAPGDVTVVPYVVVEVKLQQAPPRWLVDLVASGMLLPVPKFSKYLHGTAALFQSSLRAAPHWFLPCPASPGALLPASWEELEEGAAEILEHPALHLFPPREGGGP
ncbi:VTC domain-containing protein, partial [Helicosporidium sp. ATCC 50920]